MKCHPLRWVWGLIPLAVFSWLAALSIKEPVERDLRNRVTETLTNANLSWAKVRFDGRDGILSGRANEEGEPSKAIQVGNSVYGVRILDGQADLLRKVEPYTWVAAIAENRLMLNGFVPTETVHKQVLAAAKSQFPKAEIFDNLEFARGNPPPADFISAVKVGLKQLSHLKKGSADLSGLDLSVSGEAASSALFKDTKTALANLPKPLKLGTDKVTPPVVSPYAWAAKLAGNSVVLTGYVPSERMREAVLANAKQAFGKTGVIDKMDVADGAPSGWDKAVKVSLDQLATLQEGVAEYKAGQMTLSGVAVDDAIAETTKKAFKSQVPDGYKATEAIKGLKPAVDERELAAKREAELAIQAQRDAADQQAKRDAEAAAKAKRDADLAAQSKTDADRKAAEAKRAAELAAAEAAAAASATAAVEAKRQAEEKAKASVCEGDLRNARNAGIIQFERASDVLLRQSFPTLRQLANIASKCENVLIEIEGHTDSEGIPERNQPLSERRAQSVLNYLAENGISSDRIKAVGYGDTKPIAPNDTAENRAKNRRIEFSVKTK